MPGVCCHAMLDIFQPNIFHVILKLINIIRQILGLKISIDGVQNKMSPLISFSGIYIKLFILRRNRARIYFLTCFFCLYVGFKTGISTIK